MKLSLNQRLLIWRNVVIPTVKQYQNLTDRAVMIQSAIAELGPVPNQLGQEVRTLLKQANLPEIV